MDSVYWLIFCSIVLESFPISSSGHCLLLKTMVQRYGFFLPSDMILHNLDYALHLPIVAVITIFFYRRWRLLLSFLIRYPKTIIKLAMLGFITESITVLFYLLFMHGGTAWFPLSLGFLITTVVLYSLRYCPEHQLPTTWNMKNSLLLGIAQGSALLPGISRFGLTFVVARYCGFSGRKAFELSFLIEIPISIAAGLQGLWGLYRHAGWYVLNLKICLIMLMACFGAWLGLWCISYLIDRNMLWKISYYTLVVMIISFVV